MGKKARANAESVYNSHVLYGYKLKEIARAMGLHYTTVSRMVRAVEYGKLKK
jgi:transposase